MKNACLSEKSVLQTSQFGLSSFLLLSEYDALAFEFTFLKLKCNHVQKEVPLQSSFHFLVCTWNHILSKISPREHSIPNGFGAQSLARVLRNLHADIFLKCADKSPLYVAVPLCMGDSQSHILHFDIKKACFQGLNKQISPFLRN